MTDKIEVTQDDRDAELAYFDNRGPAHLAEHFAAHRHAALLEGVRLGLEAAAQEAAGVWKREGRILEDIEDLNPEEIVRRK